MKSNPELVIRGKHLVQAGADHDISDRLRERSERSLYVFAKGVMNMKDFTTRLHLPICNWLQAPQPRKKVLLIPRSCFKTTMARCMGIHMTIQQPLTNPYFPGRAGNNLRILFAAETEKRAISRISWIRRQYESNELLRYLWPDLMWHTLSEAPNWVLTHFSLPREEDYPESTFEAAGVDSGSTGSHYDVTIKDDIIGQRCRKMPELIPAAIEWFKTSHSLADNLKLYRDYVIGTRWAAFDVYSWIDENKIDYECLTKQIINDAFEESSILFPERFSLEEILDMKRTQPELFWLNYMNKPIGHGETAFNMGLVGKCQITGDDYHGYLDFDDSEKTREILEVIERGQTFDSKKETRPKKFWELTPEERSKQWLDMQKDWTARRMTQLECT